MSKSKGKHMQASVSIETITPQQAQIWLDNRFEAQRKVRRSRVQELVSTIRNGDWRLTCDAVTLIKGKLGNGQHRCEAIVEADKPVEALVMRTTDERLFDVIDSGATRSVADVLAQNKMQRVFILARAARMCIAYEQGYLLRSTTRYKRESMGDREIIQTITRTDQIRYVRQNKQKLEEFAEFVHTECVGPRVLPFAQAVAFLHLATLIGFEKKAKAFILSIYLGDSKDAAFDFRDRLIKNLASASKLRPVYQFGILIKAFKAYLAGERPPVYRIGPKEEFPKIERE